MTNNGGFTLGGIAASDLGIRLLRTSELPMIPDTADRSIIIPGRNGAYDFGADVGVRKFGLDCVIIKSDVSGLQEAVEAVAAQLLDPYGRPNTVSLVFDHRPDRSYQVRYSGSLPIDRIIGIGNFKLPLVAFDPFAYASAQLYDQSFEYDTGEQYDSGLYYPNTTGFQWTGVYQMAGLYNYSKYVTPIKITISGTVTNPTIKHYQTGKEIAIAKDLTPSDGDLVIDSGRYSVKIGTSNGMPYMTGDFFDLLSGDNGLIFTCDGSSADATVSIDWQHKFL